MPIGEYVSKQLLLNMDDYLEQAPLLNKSDLQMNALEAFKLNGGMYAMPSGFFLRVFIGDGDIIEKRKLGSLLPSYAVSVCDAGR
ncbi:hypothetical protein M3650_04050 [Paenibacillus sp. MER TA 81-3]|uniref:hypothetical protein n=1 Tax=Paenibacillus sp. MER TA 81-3 TaxID=2939573 RepID=UPI0020400B3A|nr:hypothetical protein [Paenibacillus sp. MER TA 81-3]MCM3337828.1 hypothetical protein [Paenibacillus sp. MER TA 81-3]